MRVETTHKGLQIFSCLPFFVKMLADQDNNLIVDEVLLGDQIVSTYLEQLNMIRRTLI